MNTAEKRTHLSEKEYFVYEDSIEGLAEYFNGEIFDMAGGSESHSSISQNVAREIGIKIGKGACRVHGADFRLRIDADNDYVRPDVWVICGKTERHNDRKDTAKNPTLVVEVQSQTTTKFDHNGKFNKYWTIPSLVEYVMIEQDIPQVDLYFRNLNGFLEFTRVTDLQAEVYFKSLGVAVPMVDIYRNVDFEAEE
jgi:Uma2 family endonuclease